MKPRNDIQLVRTIPERCRICYTCVRECPAKAIRVVHGQAEVIPERCIGCGNCVKVCSQKAKEIYSPIDEVMQVLKNKQPTIALLAPSFPAEFSDCSPYQVCGALKQLGFTYVVEVGAGADLVSRAYRNLLSENPGRSYIATTCPAVVAYVERYFPQLVPFLAPVVSPMVATARATRRMYGKCFFVVFIGPCIAKKGEAQSESLANEVNEVLTFAEMRQILDIALPNWKIDSKEIPFDPPISGPGSLFPISRGLIQSASIPEDLTTGNVIVAEGRSDFVEAIREFDEGHCRPHLLEILACEGCIMGPGYSQKATLYRRRSYVSQYVQNKLKHIDWQLWRQQMALLAQIEMSRKYIPYEQHSPQPTSAQIEEIMHTLGKFKPEDELNCGACGYDTCLEHAIAIYNGLAQTEMCLPFTIQRLRETIQNLAESNKKLEKTQENLMQAEKLASVGQLAAGIAHELNNPLGVLLMYAHLLLDEHGIDESLKEDLKMIVTQADRCKRIVSGLLHFARQNKINIETTNVPRLIEHACKLVIIPPEINVKIADHMKNPTAELDKDQIIQVLTNLITNAVQAMPHGGTLTLITEDSPDEIYITVEDTGTGIPKENVTKIFEPFFTTKEMGKGTGMGLAITYGIVKMHRGQITVESNDNPKDGPTGTKFYISLPRYATPANEVKEMDMKDWLEAQEVIENSQNTAT
ncbi:MAG TPA: [Fe-Fe] hydrogenase large subunit C-terminal domain-containing protein [Candidatus Hydrogenedens sp.]|nr:[Fe-Fe] hydrogenase large subunit C-terminal domain-containing protein [Candidatus Hydrogenedens sp.]HOL18991.1 [Fe-Fe] hydrogenase large subunit C-terminal domain-containing protein [Candidatus Hydrogenedens sp.]HPP58957.1 [Fe-Fe] hydrogenase large subunit C-terminal domain-containing protein [Candidatus Hydrogenedens sp.]